MRGNPSSSCLPNWEIDFPAPRLQRKHPPSRVPGFLTSDLGASRPPKSCKPIPRHVCVRGRMHTRIHTHAHTRHGSRSSGNPERLSLRSRSLTASRAPRGPRQRWGDARALGAGRCRQLLPPSACSLRRAPPHPGEDPPRSPLWGQSPPSVSFCSDRPWCPSRCWHSLPGPPHGAALTSLTLRPRQLGRAGVFT